MTDAEVETTAANGTDAVTETAEKPSEILPSKRPRSKTQFFKPEEPKEKEFVILQGEGTKLGDIPNVHFHLGKLKSDDDLVVQLHTFLFKRSGTTTKRKRNIQEFSGFVFDGEQEKEVTKAEERLSKWSVEHLNRLLDLFDLPRGSGEEGQKASKVKRSVAFLQAPKKLSDKDLAAEEAKKKEKKGQEKAKKEAKKEKEKAKKEAKSAKASSKKRKTPTSSSKKASKKQKLDKDAEEQDGDTADSEPEEEPAAEAEAAKSKGLKSRASKSTPKKSTAKSTPSKAAKSTPAKSTPKSAKKSTPKRGKKAEPEQEDEAPAEEEVAEPVEEAKSEEVDEEPTGGTPPSDEELEAAVKEIIKDVDVQTFNIKDLLKSLETKFKVKLADRKPHIKQVAIEFIRSSNNEDGEDEDEEHENVEEEEPDNDKGEDEEQVAESEQADAEAAKPKPENGTADVEMKDAVDQPKEAGAAAEPEAEEKEAEGAEEAKKD